MVLDEMHLETSVSKKVPMTSLATSGGFETSGVGMKKIRALFLATGSALWFGTAMTSLMVVRFPTVGTHITGPEKARQTGNDIVMAFLVQEDQLFVLDGSKRGDVKRPVGIHQQDLVTDEGRSGTEFG